MEKVESNIFEKLSATILSLLVFFLPLTVTTIFPNSFETPKLALLFIGFLILGVIKVIESIVSKKLKFRFTGRDLFVFLFILIYIVSSIVRTPNIYDAFLVPGTAAFVVLGGLYYFFINQLRSNQKKMVLYALVASAVAVSGLQLIVFLGYYKQVGYTSIGNIYTLLTFLIPTLALSIFGIIKSESATEKILYGVASFLIFVASFSAVYLVLPGKETSIKLPGLVTSWSVFVDTIKESPFFGAGPGNYSQAFNRYKPLAYNATDIWSVRFNTAGNQLLTIVTETGLLGLIALLLLAISFYKKGSLKGLKPEYVALLAFLVASLLVPYAFSLTVIIFVVMALANNRDNTKSIDVTPAVLLTLPLSIVVVVFGYFGARALVAEYFFGRSVRVLSNQNVQAKVVLDDLQRAITINPKVDRYRLFVSNVSFNLAQNLSSKEGELTEDEKNTVATLIQQTIDQAKAAASLNPGKIVNWENLAYIYKGAIPYAKGADQFAVAAYSQAIAMEPINPNLRIALGEIYYAGQDYETAIEVFKLAVLAKPDLANSHYNLGVAFRENKQTQKALEQFKATLTLLEEGSNDYSLVQKEIEKLENNTQETSTEEQPQAEQLTPPQPQAEPAIEPQIEIPQESPSPTPEAQ